MDKHIMVHYDCTACGSGGSDPEAEVQTCWQCGAVVNPTCRFFVTEAETTC